ncbi:MAG TPA: hypothetical protein EYQ50_11295 [Verrucomicrobiales bacterium]|nr:hypothetical protein [Verrucomicrobiales bacterium]
MKDSQSYCYSPSPGWLLLLTISCLVFSLTTHAQSRLKVYPSSSAPSTLLKQNQSAVGSVSNPHKGIVDPRVKQLGEFLRSNLKAARLEKSSAELDAAQKQGITRMLKSSKGPVEMRFRNNGTPILIRRTVETIPVSRLMPVQPGASISKDKATSLKYLEDNKDILRIHDPDQEFVLSGYHEDELGFRHVRFTQVYGALQVFPCELTVHINPNGKVKTLNGTYIPTPQNVSVTSNIDAEHARQALVAENPELNLGTFSLPELVIDGVFERTPTLAWKFDVEIGLTKKWRVLVNAQTGKVIELYSIAEHAGVQGSGIDGAGRLQDLQVWQEGNRFFMVDTSKAMFDPNSSPPPQGRGVIAVYDGQNRDVVIPSNSAGIAESFSATAGWLPDAVGAAWGLSKTYDYYLDKHQRNSLDGRGGTIRAIVRYKTDEPNAFFIGATTTMVFGDLQPKLIDISAHELTHGVIHSTGNGGILEYRFQSGALNESMADIFAENVEMFATGTHDWKLFLALPDGERQIRDFVEPGIIQANGRPFPSKMSEFFQLGADQDSGGVHINSSINNHWRGWTMRSDWIMLRRSSIGL